MLTAVVLLGTTIATVGWGATAIPALGGVTVAQVAATGSLVSSMGIIELMPPRPRALVGGA